MVVKDLIRGSYFPIDKVESKYAHLVKLKSATGNKSIKLFDKKIVYRLQSAGFNWFVDTSFIQKLRYCANVGKKSVVVTKLADSTNFPYFIGDIPDFAVDRIETVRRIGVDHLTIHSNEPLPISIVEAKTDPIVIGWPGGVEISGNVGSWNIIGGSGALGIVIAAWDIDKEIEL